MTDVCSNPGGEKHDPARYGSGSHALADEHLASTREQSGNAPLGGGLSGTLSRPTTLDRDASTASIRSGVLGAPSDSQPANTSFAGAGQSALPHTPNTGGSLGFNDGRT